MAVNVFEGSRRVVKLIAALWLTGCIVVAFTITPYVDIAYKIGGLGGKPIKVSDGCPPDSETRHKVLKTKSGTMASIDLCLVGWKTDGGKRVPPHQYDPKAEREEFLKELDAEIEQERVIDSFSIPEADESWVDKQWWPAYLKKSWMIVPIAVGGLIFLWVFTGMVGWIMRGFLSVPRGQDHRNDISTP